MDYEAMGTRIRKRRRWMEMTQEQLAALVGVSTSFIGHIERGSRVPAIGTLYAISRALETTMDWIVGGE